MQRYVSRLSPIPCYELDTRVVFDLPLDPYSELLEKLSSIGVGPFKQVSCEGRGPSESRTLRICSFNVMMDFWKGKPYNLESVFPSLRYQQHFTVFLEEAFDIICLNEVTICYVAQLALRKELSQAYYFSESLLGNSLGTGLFGNLILIRKSLCGDTPPSFHQILVDKLQRPAVVCQLDHLNLVVCAAHLSALTSNTPRRKHELLQITSALTSHFDEETTSILLCGDLNFHHALDDAECIPEGWQDNPYEGYTFDALKNPMHQILWPLGYESRQMKLDRFLLLDRSSRACLSDVNVIFDQPIFSSKQSEEIVTNQPNFFTRLLWQAGWGLPEKDYLFPSDHFGLSATLVVSQHDAKL